MVYRCVFTIAAAIIYFGLAGEIYAAVNPTIVRNERAFSLKPLSSYGAQKRRPNRRRPVKGPQYICPMHPDVVSGSPGRCPKCGMDLRAARPAVVVDEKAAEAAAGYFPNHILLTQDDKPVRFYDDLLKGKVVLINFMFTTCKGICSTTTAGLAKVQKSLGERVGKEVVMISISVDPETDTPEVLKKYADSFKVQPGWYFLTGEKKNVDWVLYKLGGYVEDKTQHSNILIIGNVATGEWMKVPAMSNSTEIVSAVTKLLDSQKK